MTEQELIQKAFGPPEKSMGVVEAAKEGLGLSVAAYAPGLTLSNILADVGAEVKRLGVQGQMEMASAIFGNGGFVPYGPGQYTPAAEKTQEAAQSPAQEQHIEERSRDGRSM